ncbi:kynureninase [Myroides marinus]|uniref:Kynureninase n=1 Tax=Myroides marinus TaxID=703342 RepID=A0A1H6WSU1_9FLAO|nr:kynureninase [Myroides marinus]MDM1348044.1 kynureninase [Myroides marinus]MDM1351604.1 kynureninase [Myroides marinus]MDM1355198.1 kynureninase [Myroides marinus]MDM1358811.1 kynureninase [Myroides marinus]MDM1361300.1 kynureninase [Myroides marinus]
MTFENTLAYAKSLDEKDPLAKYREEFNFPQVNGKQVIYFTGNSLGLQPKRAVEYVNEVMQDWGALAVEGHFYAEKPWWDYHERLSEPLSGLVGALPSEVTVMNTLTVNLHLLMMTFYRPTAEKYKIICEEKAFPSDQYMIQSQVRLHGLDPKEAIVELKKRPGEHNFRYEDIIAKIDEVGDEAALVLIGGLNYYTGQVFDMQAITAHAHQYGAKVGWDLAHAAGNVELKLHEWNVDFAAWCSYKYMNAGPGSASGCFVHERYHTDKELVRLAGWWGHNKERRFLMERKFDAIESAHGWQISNPSILSLAPYLASIEMFAEVGMEKLITKRDQITAYLEYVMEDVARAVNANYEIITPKAGKERGSQLSVFLHGKGKDLFSYLMDEGVIVDWREPNVVRIAPVPFYTSYEDIFRFGEILKKADSLFHSQEE